MFLFLKELCDPEKWKECQISDDNPQYRGSSLVPDCTVGSKKHGDWKERDQEGGMCGNLLKLWCFLSLKMFVLEWVSPKKSRGQERPNKVGMGSSSLRLWVSPLPLQSHWSLMDHPQGWCCSLHLMVWRASSEMLGNCFKENQLLSIRSRILNSNMPDFYIRSFEKRSEIIEELSSLVEATPRNLTSMKALTVSGTNITILGNKEKNQKHISIFSSLFSTWPPFSFFPPFFLPYLFFFPQIFPVPLLCEIESTGHRESYRPENVSKPPPLSRKS